MLLSEAIRLGAMLRPQSFAGVFLDSEGKSCAIGAACEAAGVPLQGALGISNYSGAEEAFPLLKQLELEIVIHNDADRWTRERIADWVEERERKLGLIPVPCELTDDTGLMLSAGALDAPQPQP